MREGGYNHGTRKSHPPLTAADVGSKAGWCGDGGVRYVPQNVR